MCLSVVGLVSLLVSDYGEVTKLGTVAVWLCLLVKSVYRVSAARGGPTNMTERVSVISQLVLVISVAFWVIGLVLLGFVQFFVWYPPPQFLGDSSSGLVSASVLVGVPHQWLSPLLMVLVGSSASCCAC